MDSGDASGQTRGSKAEDHENEEEAQYTKEEFEMVYMDASSSSE